LSRIDGAKFKINKLNVCVFHIGIHRLQFKWETGAGHWQSSVSLSL